MVRLLVSFVLGVYVGQEYGKFIPNVRDKAYEVFEEFKDTDLYKKICEDVKK